MVLDTVGAPYLAKNCEALAMDGKIVLIGWMGGMTVNDFDLMQVIKKRTSIIGAHPRAALNVGWILGSMHSMRLKNAVVRSSYPSTTYRLCAVCR